MIRALATATLALIATATVGQVCAQDAGTGAQLYGDTKTSIAEAALPPLKSGPNDPPRMIAERTRVFRDARAAHLDLQTAINLSATAGPDILRLEALSKDRRFKRIVVFQGATFSALQAMLADDTYIQVVSSELIADQPLAITVARGGIDFGQARIMGGPQLADRAAVTLFGSSSVSVRGGRFFNMVAVRVGRSQGITISNLHVSNAPGVGIVIAPDSHDVSVERCTIDGSASSGIAVLNDAVGVLVTDNVVSGGKGTRNQDAGIYLSDRRKFSSSLLLDGTEKPVDARRSPTNIYVTRNAVLQNRSSGIYLDGVNSVYVRGNLVDGNAKEGLCLDTGATANAVIANEFVGNGRRWGMSDEDLTADFVQQFGRTPDGSSAAKLPGISLDNAIFNLVYANHISANSGSGLKSVRTAFFNVIGHNQIESNNRGRNDRFFYFGIELGGAEAGAEKSEYLDFLPSMGNIVFQNVVTGTHYAGLQFCPSCGLNDIFDNMILGATNWAIEQTATGTQNIFTNNFSPLRSRNAHLNGSNGRLLLGGEDQND